MTNQPNNMRADINAIIKTNDIQTLVSFAERYGRELQSSGLTTSQIRLSFGQVRQIEAMWSIEGQREQAERSLMLLKPRVAYQAARDNKDGNILLSNILAAAIDAVFENTAIKSDERTLRFRRLAELFEALLAYHKVAGQR